MQPLIYLIIVYVPLSFIHVIRIQQMNTSVVEDDEVKVKVLAAPVNPSDINSIQGII